MLSACWLIGAYFLAVSSHKRGSLNTSIYGIQYIHFCPQFFQGITVVMNIIKLEGGFSRTPSPPWLRP